MNPPQPSFENHLPRRVITGRGASQSLVELCGAHGWTRVFIVSDAGVAGAGLLPSFTGGPRDSSNYVGTEFMALVSWRFADGLTWDNAAGYMIPGKALDAVTDPTVGPRNTNTPFMVSTRVRFTF